MSRYKKNIKLLVELLNNAPSIQKYSQLLDMQSKCGYRANNLSEYTRSMFSCIQRGIYQKISDNKISLPEIQVQRNLIPKEKYLQSVSDNILIAEIKRRGYGGEIYKKIAL